MIKKLQYLAIAILILAILGCTTGNVVKEETIEIGATLALSGKYGFHGQEEMNGIQMAADEINSQGGINGKRLKIIFEDNKGDAKEAVNNVNKLIYIDDVPIIISAFTHITSSINDIVANNNKILFYASTVREMAEKSNYAFRDYFDAEDSGRAIAREIKQKGYTKIKILTAVSDVCQIYEEGLIDEASKLGITITNIEHYQVNSPDFRTNLLKLDLKQEDALVLCTWRHSDIIMKQIKELGLIETQTFHLVGPFLQVTNTPEIRKLFEENNAVSSWYGISESPNNEKQLKFINDYESKFGRKPSPDAAFFYDDVHFLAKILKACNPNDANCISNGLLNNRYEGISGTLEFNSKGVSKREVPMIQMINRSWKEI